MRGFLIAAATLALTSAAGPAARAASTIDAAHPYAYAANAGWVNARADGTNGAVVGRFYCTGYLWSANAGWICLGQGPTNGWRYGNASATDWGVNHDGAGRLTGCAYGANIGWVNFEQTYGQPRVDLHTGKLSGCVWGANVGWIGLSNAVAYVRTTTLDPGPDSDRNGLPDPWEYAKAGRLGVLSGGKHDADHDGSTDEQEYVADTDPLNRNDNLRIVALAVAGHVNTVTWTTRPTRQYRLETAPALVSGTVVWSDAHGGLIGPPPGTLTTNAVGGVTASKRCYRVRSVLPLAP